MNKNYELNTNMKNEIMRWKSKLRKSSRIGVGRFLFCVQGQRIDFSFVGHRWPLSYTGMPHIIVLCFTFFTKQRFMAAWHESKSIRAIFSVAFAHFASVSHFGNSHDILTFPLLLYLLWWSGISDRWCYYCNCFGVLWTTSI